MKIYWYGCSNFEAQVIKAYGYRRYISLRISKNN